MSITGGSTVYLRICTVSGWHLIEADKCMNSPQICTIRVFDLPVQVIGCDAPYLGAIVDDIGGFGAGKISPATGLRVETLQSIVQTRHRLLQLPHV